MNVIIGDDRDKIKSLGHLCLIEPIIRELKLVDFFDSVLPKERDHYITHGEAISALVLNGLAFHPRRLYRITDFLDQLPLPLFFRPEIDSKHFNDDALGETLDKIWQFGPTELYNLLINDIYELVKDSDYNINIDNLNCDTTNFSVTGKYKVERTSKKRLIIPTFGQNKDKRKHLKMWIYGLVTNTNGIPLFMRAYSGNVSDHISLKEMMNKATGNLVEYFDDEEPHYCIFDSAGYTEKNIKTLFCKFVSRVPETIKEAKDLVSSDINLVKSNICQDYSFFKHESCYGTIPQKWFLIRSEQTAKSDDEKFKKRLFTDQKKATIALCHLNKKYDTRDEAIDATNNWIKNYPYLKFSDIQIIEKIESHYINKKCHTLGKEIKTSYRVKVKLVINEEAIAHKMMTHGRFILASNDKNLNGEEMLKIYKSQRTVENGFRILKEKEFHIGETFLKKPERIEALALIMTLCILIYSLLELRVRKSLINNNISIIRPNNTNNFNPTLKEIFKQFEPVACIESKDIVGNITYIVNGITSNSPATAILNVLGKKFLQFFCINDINPLNTSKKRF